MKFDELLYKPLYDQFDAGHNWNHALNVACAAGKLACKYCPELINVVNITAYVHDIGLIYGRDLHEVYGSEMVLNDLYLKSILTSNQLEIVADAILNHRASNGHPVGIVAKIIADSDRCEAFDSRLILIRTYNYSNRFFDNIDDRLLYAINHVVEKFITGGPKYKIPVAAKCHFPETKIEIKKMGIEVLELFNMHDINAIKQFIGL